MKLKDMIYTYEFTYQEALIKALNDKDEFKANFCKEILEIIRSIKKVCEDRKRY